MSYRNPGKQTRMKRETTDEPPFLPFFLGHKDHQKAESSAVLWPRGDLAAIKRGEGIFEKVGKHLKGGMTAFVLCSKRSDLFWTRGPALPDSAFSIMHQTGFHLTRCGCFQLACPNRTQDSGPTRLSSCVNQLPRCQRARSNRRVWETFLPYPAAQKGD